MFRHPRNLVMGCIILGAIVWLAVAPSGAKDQPDPAAVTETPAKPGLRKTAMKAFMRKKLAASQDILEGLALEDFELIEKGTRQLKAISAAAEFMAVKDSLYSEHADDFRRIVGKLERAAKEQRVDGATLGFVDLTMSCVECHRYVRTILIAQ